MAQLLILTMLVVGIVTAGVNIKFYDSYAVVSVWYVDF